MDAANKNQDVPDSLDPYHRWLGIPPKDQPPNHYRLLAIELFEDDAEVIRDAAERQIAHVRRYALGKHAELSQHILNELGAAKACLSDPAKKSAYDERLRQHLQPSSGPADRPEAPWLDPGLAAVLETKRTSAVATTSGGAAKKSQPKPAVLIGATALTVAVVGLVALWWAMARGGSTKRRGTHEG